MRVAQRSTGLLQRVRGIAESLRASVARGLAPVIEGFHEHGWSGRLYLLTSGLSLAVTVPVFLSIAGVALTGLFTVPRPTFSWIPFALMLGGMAYVQWKVLRGVALFRRWAWYVATFVTFSGMIGGLGWLVVRGAGVARLAGLCELALAGQFFLYFARNHARFEPRRRPASLEEQAMSLADADPDPPYNRRDDRSEPLRATDA
jgi:hypothetical protein